MKRCFARHLIPIHIPRASTEVCAGFSDRLKLLIRLLGFGVCHSFQAMLCGIVDTDLGYIGSRTLQTFIPISG